MCTLRTESIPCSATSITKIKILSLVTSENLIMASQIQRVSSGIYKKKSTLPFSAEEDAILEHDYKYHIPYRTTQNKIHAMCGRHRIEKQIKQRRGQLELAKKYGRDIRVPADRRKMQSSYSTKCTVPELIAEFLQTHNPLDLQLRKTWRAK